MSIVVDLRLLTGAHNVRNLSILVLRLLTGALSMRKERTIIFDRLTSVTSGIALNAREYLFIGTVLVCAKLLLM